MSLPPVHSASVPTEEQMVGFSFHRACVSRVFSEGCAVTGGDRGRLGGGPEGSEGGSEQGLQFAFIVQVKILEDN